MEKSAGDVVVLLIVSFHLAKFFNCPLGIECAFIKAVTRTIKLIDHFQPRANRILRNIFTQESTSNRNTQYLSQYATSKFV